MKHKTLLMTKTNSVVPSLAGQLSRLWPGKERSHLAQDAIADALWAYCQSHGTAPLVYHNLQSKNLCNQLPESVAEGFRKTYYRTLTHNLQCNEVLHELISVLAGFEIIILKGPVLIDLIYKNPALRPMTDIDLLAHPADAQQVSTAIQSLSFVPAPNYPDVLQRNNIQIDLHTHPFNTDRINVRDTATPLDMDRIWIDAAPFQQDTPFKKLSLPHQVLTLAVHALKHGFERDIWLIDILGTLKQASDTAQWEAVLTSCDQARALGILAHATHAIQNRLLDKMPEPAQKLQKSFPIGPIRRKILKNGISAGDFQILEPLILMHSVSGLINKIRCLTEFIFPRKPVLTQISNLSGKWTFYLSYPYRILQIAIRGSIQVFRLLKHIVFNQ